MSTNRVYYGEYSAEHWINLLATRNIILPEFQRSFVWSKEDVKKYIKSIKDGQFIPPVTIGRYENAGTTSNIIVDGQQRLTSLFLAYLGKFPKKDAFAEDVDELASGLESEDETDNHRRKWSIEELRHFGSSYNEIKDKIQSDSNYEQLDETLDVDEIKKIYLGFSYLVPANDINRYYARVFNSINALGNSLSQLESRISLYFMEPSMKAFFDPDIFVEYKITRTSNSTRMDFVRYLSTLVDLENHGRAYVQVASGYSKDMEGFYMNFIEEMVSQMQSLSSDEDTVYKKLFSDDKFSNKIDKVKRALVNLDIPKGYTSIIDMDVYFYGLLFWTLIKGKEFKSENKDSIKQKIEAKIASFKTDQRHTDNPNRIGYLRNRMSSSIDIYDEYDE